MSVTLVIFYLVFISQILLISLYFPGVIRKRILFVIQNYPPTDYPKLYPKPYDHEAGRIAKTGLRGFKLFNWLIAAVGFAILGAAWFSGYLPSPLGGDEIFVMFYFMLQISPILFIEVKSFSLQKRMREAHLGATRSADLNPRRLFDFVSPALFGFAVLLFTAWLGFYLYSETQAGPFQWNTYVTIGSVVLANLFMAAVAAKTMLGKKTDPHLGRKDRLDRIGIIIKSSTLASIGISIFLFLTNLADTYGWEIYDPVMTSVYFQIFVVLAYGLGFRKVKLEKVDFEVYKNGSQPTTP